MDDARYLECLAADFARLRAVAADHLCDAVPSCPGWTVTDLVRHVAQVYLHKTRAMQEGVEPGGDDWPPAGLAAEDPMALLDRAYAGLRHELETRDPAAPAGSWYAPDQTVGFWVRRMAQETVIHRFDAELAAGVPAAATPDDLAVDGVDELLKVFVSYGVSAWGEYFAAVLGEAPTRSYRIRAGDAAWRVETGPGRFDVSDGAGEGPADLTVSGPPVGVLRWVWNREEPAVVTVDGDPAALVVLKGCIVTATQ